MRTNLSGIFLSFYLFSAPRVYAEESPQIEPFSPQGTAKAVRQVTARFSSPMVPFGDPRGLIDPFDIRCSGMGTGRWVDGKNLVFDFEKDLPLILVKLGFTKEKALGLFSSFYMW